MWLNTTNLPNNIILTISRSVQTSMRLIMPPSPLFSLRYGGWDLPLRHFPPVGFPRGNGPGRQSGCPQLPDVPPPKWPHGDAGVSAHHERAHAPTSGLTVHGTWFSTQGCIKLFLKKIVFITPEKKLVYKKDILLCISDNAEFFSQILLVKCTPVITFIYTVLTLWNFTSHPIRNKIIFNLSVVNSDPVFHFL